MLLRKVPKNCPIEEATFLLFVTGPFGLNFSTVPMNAAFIAPVAKLKFQQ